MGAKYFGAVRFDIDDPNAGGWASVEGGEAFRIANAGSLDSSTVWWTNLSFDSMWKANIHRMPNLKRTNYMHSWRRGDGQDAFCESWGLVHRRYTEKSISEALSAIFAQVMRVAARRYKVDLGQREVFPYDTLADEIRSRLLPVADPTLGPEADSAIGESHLYYNTCMTPHHRTEDYVDVCFAKPAVAYAREMTGTIIPSDQVEYRDSASLPAFGQRLDWVLNDARPILARVSVSDVHPDFANLISYGNGGRAGTNRNWLTQPEILLLSNFARVEIESAYVFSEYRQMPPQCVLPSDITNLQAMTPNTQILATNHWIGLCRENPYRLEPGKSSERRTSPRAAWLTSVDRFHMFTSALSLHQAGFTICYYGAGCVVARVPKFNYRDAYEVAVAAGLLAPTTMSEDIDVQEDLQNVG
ncbi:hypothetical protein Q6A26_03915 [Xanthomonas euvesicatoria pv. eucalypti]|uniref:hypothetical protein n=1 Tax=Lysobacteraceae TaxID=32033 RepID=UPI00080DEABD|nr:MULTISPECIES: hypothetical protein [Xanthomonadaceae]MCC8799167.1 hypothetical protein [Xanthomonas euvesicatoria pv. euvesicatoria]MCC8807772.1 hypothetical protein [Xanthomonas euvesicatoria pv. euvesicatoria]MCC8816217.1 hypothetical protein [Xanthomonas euvesicatoria pv. euvesicatoria]MDO7931507.1 hypothetical protein [Xanthomonas euvesicatoria pv. eucalypti]MDO7935766.1 hypothetical protein [Xanthomonas euvesicatoria pv. eucalypti]